MKKAAGGCIQAAKRILTGQQVRPPTAEVAAEVRRLLPGGTYGDNEQSLLDALMAAAQEARGDAPAILQTHTAKFGAQRYWRQC